MTSTEIPRAPVAPVTRASIAQAALEIIRVEGLRAVTMRAVAARLGIRAPSLYEHVRDKADLLDLVAREAFADGEIDTSGYDGVRSADDWVRRVVEGSLGLRDVYLRHPGLAGLMLSTLVAGRDRDDGSRAVVVRAQIDALRRLGVAEETARRLFEAASFWSLSAIVGEGLVDADLSGHAREERYRTGLALMAEGLRTSLADAVGAPTGEGR